MNAGFDSLIVFLLFILLTGASSWLQRKRGEGEKGGGEPSPGPQPGKGRALDWEEELRRLLGEEPAPPPSPPPPIQPAPAEARRPPPTPKAPSQPPPAPPAHQVKAPQAPEISFQASGAAHERAIAIKGAVSKRMERVRQQVRGQGPPATAPLPAESAPARGGPDPAVAELVRRLRHPSTARQAVVAAMILQPPKALVPEEEHLLRW